MHDAGGVRGGHAFGNLDGDVERLGQRHRPVVEDLPERASRHQLHHEHVGVVDREDVEDRDDMGIVECGGGARFVEEAGATLMVVGFVRRQDLEGDAAIEAQVDRLVHHAHAAGAQLGEDLVVHQRATDHA